jgi:hypothetical protein
MVALQTQLLTVAFAIGIAATGATLAAGVTSTGGDGVVGVDREPLAIDNIGNGFASANGEDFESNTFTTAEGADVFDMAVTNISGGNDFNVSLDLNNTGDSALYLVIEASTSESIILNDVTNTSGTALSDIVEVENGVFVASLDPDTAKGYNNATLDFDYTVANDADANANHEFDINLEFEERSPSQT